MQHATCVRRISMDRQRNLRSGICQIIAIKQLPWTLFLLVFLFGFDIFDFFDSDPQPTISFFVTARSQPLNSHHRRRSLFESSLKQHYGNISSGFTESIDDRGDDDCVFYKPYSSPTRLHFEFDKFYWVYQLCPNKSMKHLRVEIASMSYYPEVDVISVGNMQLNVAERYNLGSYVNEKVGKDCNNGYGEGCNKRMDYYHGGDICDVSVEKGDRITRTKATKVVHEDQCCWQVSDFDGSLQSQNPNHSSQFRIMDVDEQLDCMYVARICSICSAMERDQSVTQIGDDNCNEGQENNQTFGSEIIHKKNNSDNNDKKRPQQLDLMDIYLQNAMQSNAKMVKDEHHFKDGLYKTDPESFPPVPPSKIISNRALIRSMFQHAYDGYMYNAFPASELKPLSCKPGSFKLVRIPALTLIDILDTLLIMGNHTEFARGVERLRLLDNQMKLNTEWDEGIDHIDNPNSNEFNEISGGLFAVNQNVSVFETNIRVLGGLLSAHQMAIAWMNETALVEDILHENGSVLIGDIKTTFGTEKTGNNNACKQNSSQLSKKHGIYPASSEACKPSNATEDCKTSSTNLTAHPVYWKYDGILLSFAYDIGKRLLPAFNTKTGIPYGTVNLLNGIPHGETTTASLAGAGTLSVEMELLSRLTGDASFGKAAKLAIRALWSRRSSLNLVGKHIDIRTGAWMENLSGIGSNSDSFYEYLIKHYFLFPEDEEFWVMFQNMYSGIFNQARFGDWYIDVDMNRGLVQRAVFESLAAFYPGMQVLLGEFMSSSRTANSFASVREYTSLLPEWFDFLQWNADTEGAAHLLRPEIHESTYFLHAAMEHLPAMISDLISNETVSSSGWLWSADFSLHAIERLTKVECGYGSLRAVPSQGTDTVYDPENLADEMPSYFLSETLKYLFLSFDSSNVLHNDKEREWIFTTEAHPVHHVSSNFHEVKRTGHDLHLSNMRKRVLNILKKPKPMSSIDLSKDLNQLKSEKWTLATTFKNHVKDVQNTVATIGRTRSTKTKYFDLFGRIMRKSEICKEEFFTNFASLSHNERGKGDGDYLSKTCPSHSNPNGLWIEALSGDEFDYTDFFLSYRDDDEMDSAAEISASQMPTALIGSALYGTTHLSRNRSQNYCRISDMSESWLKSNPKSQHKQSPNQVPPRTQRIDGGRTLGMFDVLTFEQSTGYFVKHENSGESVEVTIFSHEIDDIFTNNSSYKEENSATTVVTIDSYTPKNSEKKIENGLFQTFLGLSLSKIHGSGSPMKNSSQYEYERNIAISDMNGNTFFCEVEIKRPLNVEHESNNSQHYDTVATFPCLGAMYGRTHMARLVETGGVEVKAILRTPDKLDEFGCGENASTRENQGEGNLSFIQLTRRGECTFRQKAMHEAGPESDVEAVIIINSDDDKIFLMVGDEDEEELKDTAKDEPISILVSKRDGDRIISMVNKYESNLEPNIGKVQALVRISKQQQFTDGDSNPVEKWPIIFTDSKKIQVLASSGWGVVSVKKPDLKSQTEWQIMILQHNANR